jgi:peptidoglycan/xylan/chitin deacetylase (PgdA/CDA1 family)
VKTNIFSISEALGIHRVFATLNRRLPIVLNFHGVTAEPPGHICNDEGLHLYLPIFERLMEYVARHYHAVPLSRIVDWLEGTGDLPDRAVAITLDDGYRDVLVNAAPVLNRLHIPATLFAVTDFVFGGRMLWPDRIVSALAMTTETEISLEWADGTETFPLRERSQRIDAMRRIVARCKSMPTSVCLAHTDRIVAMLGLNDRQLVSAWDDLRPLDPDEMKQLPDLGIEIGSHTCSHPILTQLEQDAMKRELVESKRTIESCLGRPCTEFAYPNGGPADFDTRSRRQVIEAGYRCAVTTIKMRVPRGIEAFEIPRCTFTHNRISVAEFDAQVSGFAAAVRSVKHRVPAAR